MANTNQPVRLLVVEDNPGDFALFEAYLQQSRLPVAGLLHAASLAEATALASVETDLAFLDLSLPDSRGEESFLRLHEVLPHTPIVVLSGLADEALALKCIALGAQDYLLKDDLNEKLLEKSVAYSIERTRNLEKIADINRQYELIGNITNDIIWTWHLGTGTVHARKAAFFDYAPGEVGTTLDWWVGKVHPADYEKICAILTAVVEGRIENLQVEYRFRCASGAYRYVFNRGVLLRDKGGEPVQMTGAIMDITERHELQEELLQAQVNLQKGITEAAILGQEKEKEAIGKELHDNINQVLASTKLYLDVAAGQPELQNEMVGRARKNLVYAMDEIRRLSHSLIPPSLDDHGLLDSVRELAGELEKGGAFTVHLLVEDFDESVLDDNKKLMLYRVVQEGLSNIVKYARATKVHITFAMQEDRLHLHIVDNGAGFDTTRKAKGVGLRNIESRVAYYTGTVHISSSLRLGTKLTVVLPL